MKIYDKCGILLATEIYTDTRIETIHGYTNQNKEQGCPFEFTQLKYENVFHFENTEFHRTQQF